MAIRHTYPLALIGITLAACTTSPTGSTGTPSNTTPIPASNVVNGVDLMKLEADTVLSVGTGPHGMTALENGLIVNANPKSGDVNLIDGAASPAAVVKTLPPLIESPTASSSPSYFKHAPDERFAVNLDGGIVGLRVFDALAKDWTATGKIALPGKPGSKFVWATTQTDEQTLFVPTAGATNLARVRWENGFEQAPTVTPYLMRRTPGADETLPTYTTGFVAMGGGFIALPDAADNAVHVQNLDTANQPTGSVRTFREGNAPGPLDLATFDGVTTLVFGNKNSNNVILADPSKNGSSGVLAVLNVGSTPTDMVLSSDHRRAFITCKGSGEVAIVDVKNRTLSRLLKVGRNLTDATPNPVHIYRVGAPAGYQHEQVWVGGDGDASVTVIDAVDLQVIAVVKVGNGHHKMAFTDKRAFVSNLTDNTVSVIERGRIHE
ncbi:MAG: hypothetical protein VKP72_03890 [bacterium]|nr:hypothetical protein [bacterium]